MGLTHPSSSKKNQDWLLSNLIRDELIPMRTTTGWRMCVDYRKLNSKTKKDHFPLPFLDQILERVAGHALYCFSRWVFGILSNRYSSGGPIKNDIYLSFRHFRFQTHAFSVYVMHLRPFQRCVLSIFENYVEKIVEVFMDDFTVYGDSFNDFFI